MAKKKKLPVVAICGRPNVGKSTLYNRIFGKQRAIIMDQEGITRDRHQATAKWHDYVFTLVDTGGIVEHPEDAIVEKMQEQVRMALNEATVIVFVVDGQAELTRVDYELRDELLRFDTPIILATNKLDNDNMEMNRFNFYELGMGEPYAISSGHGIGIEGLMEAVAEHLPTPEEVPEDLEEEDEDVDETEEQRRKRLDDGIIRVAVVGKPNVGKSSFINAILNEERVIVDNTPGTTRDAIDIEFQWKDKEYIFIDTAGMRKKAGIKEQVEYFSITRSLRAIRRADVCLVMIDGTGGISEQDKRILGYIYDQGTAAIIVWTKWDLIEDKEERFKELKNDMFLKMPHLKYVPFITISNTTRQRLFKSFELIDRIAECSQKRVSTNELNKIVKVIKAKHNPPSMNGKHAKILYATQTSVKPTTFIFFVNQKRLFHFSYVRFMENQLREAYGFEGVPIQIDLREEKGVTNKNEQKVRKRK